MIRTELRKKGVTLRLLWVEYREAHPDGYGYSQFCAHYREWAKHLKPSMRLTHKGGEKVFVDYAGGTQNEHVEGLADPFALGQLENQATVQATLPAATTSASATSAPPDSCTRPRSPTPTAPTPSSWTPSPGSNSWPR